MKLQYINLDGDLEGKEEVGGTRIMDKGSEGITGYDFPRSSYFEMKRLMKSVYDELERPEGTTLRTFEETFKSIPFFAGTGTDCEVDTKCFLY